MIGNKFGVSTRIYYKKGRYRWPCRQSYRSAVARSLGLWVQIPLMARMFFPFLFVLYCVGNELIPPSEEPY